MAETPPESGLYGAMVRSLASSPTDPISTAELARWRDAIAIRSMMNLCMSFDHRINDGAEASAFLQSVKGRLEAITPDTPIY